MKITKLTAEILADDPEALRILIDRPLRLNEKKSGTFVEGLMFPEVFGKYAVTLPRGGAIIPGISPEQLGEMISWAAHDRFHFLRDDLEKNLREIFEVRVQLGFSVSDRQDHWTLRVFSPMIPKDWWNEDFGADEILTECFFRGSVEPMASFHDLANWKRHIQEMVAFQKRQREYRHKEEQEFLVDPSHWLQVTTHASNTKFEHVMEEHSKGTPVALLQDLFRQINFWDTPERRQVFRRGFRIKIDGKQDWAFYQTKDALLAALKKAWPVAYERAEQQQ